MICPSCGFRDAGRFCKHCGAPLIAEDVAKERETPQHAGVTLPPPSAEEGFKAEQLLEDGTSLEGHGHSLADAEEASAGQGNSFGLFLVMLLVVAFVVFAVKMMGGAT
ncbi:MAG: hypothetical protein VKO21_11680 [Candidatus Sericytochromatia bacterium]|nr:hypothetical protein [Candidatus Sericytochromatia bacterium]